MKRIIPAVAVVLFAVVGPVTATQAAGNATVTFVQGVGPAPMPVDVYIDDALEATNIAFGATSPLTLAEGSHTVKICNHNAAPPDPLVGLCPSGGVNQNSGDTVSVVGGSNYTLVAAYAPSGTTQGRPVALLFQDDLSCTSATRARMDMYHAAAFAGDIDGSYGTEQIFSDVPPAGVGRASGNPKTEDLRITRSSDSTVLVDQAAVATAAQQLTIKILVGNPQQEAAYTLITRQIPLTGCPATTTTTVIPSTSTTSTVRVVTVTPRFTG